MKLTLMPLDSIAVVRWELVVEVVVALTESNESGDDVIPGRVAVVEGLVTEPVSKRVDAEGGLLDEEDAENARVDESTLPVTPAQASDNAGEANRHKEDDWDVVLVLEDDDGILVQVGNVGAANALGVLLHDHPSQVRVEETLANRVGVLLSVGVPVVGTVAARPPPNRTLDSSGTSGSEEDLERSARRVRAVGPETMVSGSDSETTVEVVGEGPDDRLELERSREGVDEAHQRNEEDEGDVEPVNVLVPVAQRHFLRRLE